MKTQNKGIKYKIINVFIAFIILIILVCWIFQVFLVEDIYISVKKHKINEMSNQISEVVSNNHISEEISDIIGNSDIDIFVLDSDFKVMYPTQQDMMFRPMELNIIQDHYYSIVALQNLALKNGEASKVIISEEKKDFKDNEPPKEPHHKMEPSMQNICCIKVLNQQNDQRIILLTSKLTPVDVTIETVQLQLFFIAIILIVIAVFFAFYLTKILAKPLVSMNESAKQLAKGNYEVVFEGKGYKEIDELNATLNYATKELSKVENLRRELIANMSHDLRTPLTMISGYGEIMRDIPGENSPENAQIIIDEAKKLTTFVSDILDLSKFQANLMVLNKTKFNITREIQSMANRFEKFLSHEKIQIIFEFQEEIEIEGDYPKILRAIYNLLINSINYCGEDKLVIIKQEVINNQVKFSFIDHGEGIKEEDLPYIWDRYYKIDKNHKRSKIGSGIGLSIVKEILDLHGYSYGVESQVNQGSIFYFIVNT